ncbi:MAG: arginase family protein [Desulfobacteraceae bacterium]|nr:arginase family protein [Desulfobacteraceae bacterium]
MEKNSGNKVIFFGCPLDCDEKPDSIQEKLTRGWIPGKGKDPFEMVMKFIRNEVPRELWDEQGSLDVPGWLLPKPPSDELWRITVGKFVAFTDQDGCRTIASEVENFVKENILPHIPCMIAVDHSLTGGVFRSLADHYGKENISLVILDSHTDAIPMSVSAQAIQYDIDNNPNSVYDKNDPFFYDRTDSYNASSFVHYLLAEQAVKPKNLYLIGVSDYPEKRTLRTEDPRIARYVSVYTGMKRSGVKILTKKDCLLSSSKIKNMLEQLSTPYVYISVDMDIGSGNAVEGVRFRDWQGLNANQIYRIADALAEILSKRVKLAGMDITEINPRRAGRSQDKTYQIAANLIRKIAFET